MTKEPEQSSSERNKLRVFTAIAFPPEVTDRVSDLLMRLQKGANFTGAHPVWVRAENVHITLVFLGSQPEERISELREACDATAGAFAPFRLKLGGLHLFPNPKEPRVVSLGMTGDLRELSALREKLADELRARNFPVESRPFRPHITLARIKSMRGVPGLRDLIAGHQRVEPGLFEVAKVTLYKSTLTRSGSNYEILHEARLNQSDSPEAVQ